MASVTLRGQQQPVRVGTIYCLGHNYSEHVKEMRAGIPVTPVVFLKPAAALSPGGGNVEIPPITQDCQHEMEITVLLSSGGRHIRPEHALDHVAGYGIGLDMTLRDVQGEAKKKGLPWTLAKGFATSAPVSDFVPRSAVPDPSHLEMTLTVNGTVRQHAVAQSMIFPIDQVISYLSSVFVLEAGDLIFTGTPEGVSRVVPGDRMHAELHGLTSLDVGVTAAHSTLES
jgi:acylpyruvate hydrolase